MAYRDELTGLPGRRALNECLQRVGATYTIAMVDVDHFKRFNDTHGHDNGDDVLKLVAARLAGVGGGGRAFRYGGEEFAIVMPDTDSEAACKVLDEIRRRFAEIHYPAQPQDLWCTFSAGVVDLHDDCDSLMMASQADAALYRAKAAGRDRIDVDDGRAMTAQAA